MRKKIFQIIDPKKNDRGISLAYNILMLLAIAVSMEEKKRRRKREGES